MKYESIINWLSSNYITSILLVFIVWSIIWLINMMREVWRLGKKREKLLEIRYKNGELHKKYISGMNKKIVVEELNELDKELTELLKK